MKDLLYRLPRADQVMEDGLDIFVDGVGIVGGPIYSAYLRINAAAERTRNIAHEIGSRLVHQAQQEPAVEALSEL